MAISIINSFASWVLKQRIHQIELFLKYPNEVQEELLLNLIREISTIMFILIIYCNEISNERSESLCKHIQRI